MRTLCVCLSVSLDAWMNGCVGGRLLVHLSHLICAGDFFSPHVNAGVYSDTLVSEL